MHEGMTPTARVGRRPEAGRLVQRHLPRPHLDLVPIDRVQEQPQIFCSLVAHYRRASVTLSHNGAHRDFEEHWKELTGDVRRTPVRHAQHVRVRALGRRHSRHAGRADHRLAKSDGVAGLDKGNAVIIDARAASGREGLDAHPWSPSALPSQRRQRQKEPGRRRRAHGRAHG